MRYLLGVHLRYAKKTDRNHSEIRDGLRGDGWAVYDLSDRGKGVPDLAVKLMDGRSLFLEVKSDVNPPSKQRLTEAQTEWWMFFGYMTEKVTSLEEAREAVMRHFR